MYTNMVHIENKKNQKLVITQQNSSTIKQETEPIKTVTVD